MKRLTEKGVIYGDIYLEKSKNHECLNKLSKYENTELEPEEVEKIKKEVEIWRDQAIKWAAQLGELRLRGDKTLAEYEHRDPEDKESIIQKIQQALNVQLNEFQIKYIFEDDNVFAVGRTIGKTQAYCIKLSLSKGDPIDMRYSETIKGYAEKIQGPHYLVWFRDYFKEIYLPLLAAGLPVREVIF
jgi:hypothetical protein